MSGARVGATLHGAVLSIPSGDTEAGTILALPVFVAAGIALFHVAKITGPARNAVARVIHAMTVRSTVQVAEFCKMKEKVFLKSYFEEEEDFINLSHVIIVTCANDYLSG